MKIETAENISLVIGFLTIFLSLGGLLALYLIGLTNFNGNISYDDLLSLNRFSGLLPVFIFDIAIGGFFIVYYFGLHRRKNWAKKIYRELGATLYVIYVVIVIFIQPFIVQRMISGI